MGQTNIPEFFKCDDYFIDEKVGLLKYSNAYKVYNDQAVQIGNVQQTVPVWHKILRLFINKVLFPFSLDITDMNGVVVASIRRGWNLWFAKIEILDGNGVMIGGIKQKFKLLKPLFNITDQFGTTIAQIKGDWKAWNFNIVDGNEKQLGTINKKWAGFMKEAFTTADKYRVIIEKDCPEDINKIAIVAGAITIDMVMKEGK
jgi:uncharacterized protein YxjI